MSANAVLTVLGPGDFGYWLTDVGVTFECWILNNFNNQIVNFIRK